MSTAISTLPRPIAAFALGLFGLGLAGCSTPHVDLTPRVGKLSLSGDFSVVTQTAGPPATTISGSNSLEALGLDEDGTEFLPRADVDAGPMLLTIDHLDFSTTGEGTIDQDIVFDGITFNATETVTSAIDLQITRGVLTWDFVPTDAVDVGLGFGVGYVALDASIEDASNNRAQTNESTPYPFIAGRVGTSFGDLEAEALVTWIGVDVDDVDASLLDLDITARYNLLGVLDEHLSGWIVLGYRWVDLELD
ncbi:MAG: hypothetical protein ACYS26_16375, partial [Planctomycetota bacterium]